MTARRRKWSNLLIPVILVGVFFLGAFPGEASSSHRWTELDRWDPETPSPTGQRVAAECNAQDATDPETWPEAVSRLRLKERDGRTEATFVIRNARPNTLYTVWLRLLGTDSNGNPYGGSPLTGIPVTPLSSSKDLPDQLAKTLPNPGSADPVNGFWTNARGNGRVAIWLDFPITSGAYPFHRFADWEDHKDDIALTNEANVGRLGGMPAAIRPEAIGSSPQAPATILIASHCVDGLAHGLLPGPHENWFTWSY